MSDPRSYWQNENRRCRVYKGIHIIETVEREKSGSKVSRFRRVDKDHYIDKDTGEMHQYKNDGKRRSDNQQGLIKSFNTLRRLINCNFGGWNSELHIVLTYGELMGDYHQARRDFKNFWARLKRKYPMCEYISVCEPQESGSWHIHVLVKRNDRQFLHIPNEEVTALWKNGQTYTDRLPFADNFGAYFTAICYSPKDAVGELMPGKKYSRLKYYPDSYRVYSCSKGITRIITYVTTMDKVREMVDGCPVVVQTIEEIVNPVNNEHVNTIVYTQYNKRLKNKSVAE